MKTFFTLALVILCISFTYSQSTLEWSPNYQLQLSDFQSPQTEIDGELKTYSIYSGANIDFSFSMSIVEFMFTKNFNNKAKTVFNKKAAVIIAPDSAIVQQLLSFGQYNFDLTELYTRKFRKQMNEQKGIFSDPIYFQPIFMKLQEELNSESARVLKLTDLGKQKEMLQIEHQKVLAQIETMSDFCFTCKPPKKEK